MTRIDGGGAAAPARALRSNDRPSALPPRRDERLAAGKTLRDRVPRAGHGEWKPPKRRRDPVEMVTESSAGRVPDLVPIRYWRMAASPFTLFRGAANIMAADLASTPATGIAAQLCGDCHALNFNGFATPERRVIFDVADFDETLPGPWEWDVKRLAVSFVLAARSNGFPRAVQREAAASCVRSYREHMAEYARMPVLGVWYASVDQHAFTAALRRSADAIAVEKRIEKAAAQWAAGDGFPKVVRAKGGRYAIADDPPLIYHPPYVSMTSARGAVLEGFARYRDALPHDRRVLLDRYRLMDVAAKVVGVGSVGTFCGILLLMAEDDDPLFLQVKEAGPSVLERYSQKSEYPNQGQRVVVGQRAMQAASDLFLGWFEGRGNRHYYVRQLHDMKIKPRIERMDRVSLADYAAICGWTLAHAHARSADAAMIAGYLGGSDRFDRAVARFGTAYADQVERDYEVFTQAVRDGRIETEEG